MTLSSEHLFTLKAIAAAGDIVNGRTSCRASNFGAECTPEALDYMKRRKLYGLAAIGSAAPDPLFALYLKVWHIQYTALKQLVEAAASEGIELLLYKGGEITERYCHSLPLALRGDIDVVVREETFVDAKRVLHSLGYVQAEYDTVNRRLVPISSGRIAKLEANNYSPPSFARLARVDLTVPEAEVRPTYMHPLSIAGSHATVVIAIEVATGLDQRLDTNSLFECSSQSVLEGARALRAEDHIWYTAAMFYLGTYLYKQDNKLTKLADLAVMLDATAAELDWDYIVRRSRELEVLPSVYYTLAFLNAAGRSPRVPASVLSALSPAHGSRVRDYGWQLHKLFGAIEPMPYDLLWDN